MRLPAFFKSKRWHGAGSHTWERTPPHMIEDYIDTDGRRHRADAPYLLPKDSKEIERLDYQHFILRQVLEGNTFAPVDALLRRRGGGVLDVGCGTGRWGQEIARAYPLTTVAGFDLEDVPRSASAPLNYQFYCGNVLNGLPFVSRSFQYVHQRLLVAGLPFQDWPYVIGELKRVTDMGGWVELVEMGNGFHDAGPATKQFLTWWIAISASRGIDAAKMSELGNVLQHAGLFSVKGVTKRLAVGRWGGRLGNLLAQNILAGWPTMRPLAQALLHVAPETFDDVIAHLEEEWNTRHTTYDVYFFCGQV